MEGSRSEQTSAVSQTSKLKRHSVYYLDHIIFAVEDTLFRVPRVGFEGRSGTPFEAFASLQKFNSSAEGYDDDHPVYLHGVKTEDFANLLGVMYPNLSIGSLSVGKRVLTPSVLKNRHHASSPHDQSQTLGKKSKNHRANAIPHVPEKHRWLSVLHLSTLWAFDDLRKQVISQLSKADLGRKELIDLAKMYNVPQWLVQGYCMIISQASPLDRTGDLEDLDWETMGKLFMIRERYPPNERLSALLDIVTSSISSLYNGYGRNTLKEQVMSSFNQNFSANHAVDRDQVVPSQAVNLEKIVEEQFARELADLKY